MTSNIKNQLLFATLLTSVIMVTLAPTLSIIDAQQNIKPDNKDKTKQNKEKQPKDKQENPNKGKDKDKVKNCQVKAQLKVYGAEANQTLTAQLETLIPQSKVAENATEPVTFNFQYKKGDITCPIKEELPKTVYGTVNGEYFSGIIKSITKQNKLTYELQGLTTSPE
jgi:hypothetical protein